MSPKPAVGIAVAISLAIGCVQIVTAVSEPAAVDAEQYAAFFDNEVFDVQDLAEGAEIQRRTFNRMTPPGVFLFQPMIPPVAPFDADNFDDAFLEELLGEDKYSVAIYPLSLALDPKTRETLVYNADGMLIATIPADKAARHWPEGADPSRVTLQLDLLATEDVEPYLYVERRISEYAEERAAKSGKAAKRSLGPAQFGIAGVRRLTNGVVRVTVTNGTDAAEIYSYTVAHTSSAVVATWTNDQQVVVTSTNLLWHPVSPPFKGIQSAWVRRTTHLALTNGVGAWDDANVSSNDRLRFYAAAKRGDADGDGLTDGAEILLHRTDPHSLDTDEDGMPDGWELQNTFNPLDDGSVEVRNGADGDPDGDDLRNLDEYLRGLNPLVNDWPVVLHVDGTTGNDQTGDGSTNAPYQTIGKATQVGAPYLGCIVRVAGGTYEEFPQISLCSDLQLCAVTGQTVKIQGILSGYMATNIQLRRLTVESVVLTSCSAEASEIQGGNIVVENSNLQLENSRFDGYGSGLDCSGSSVVTVANSFFSHCGDACRATANANIRLLNTVLVRNNRGIYGQDGGSLDMNHCVLAYNHWQGIVGGFSNVSVSNSVVWQNNEDIAAGAQVDHCAFAWPLDVNTNGNIQVSDPGWINTALDNYRLRSDSPLINKGGADSAADIDGEARPCGGASDIGIDEMRDADADGLADVWEQVNNATSPTQNLDGDSMNNLEEYRRGFDPRVPDGPIQVYISLNGSDETGDGSSSYPFATIGIGVDWAVAHGGGTVNFSAGDWWDYPFEMGDEVTLKGAGRDSTTLHTWWSDWLTGDTLFKGNRNVGIEDMTVTDDYLTAWRSDNVSLKRVRVAGQLMLWSVNKGLLDEVEVSQSCDAGMEIWRGKDLIVNRCNIHDSNGSGIHAYPPLTGTVVSNTIVAHNKGHGIHVDGTWNTNATASIRHSVVAFNRDSGIHWNSTPSGATVRNSILWHNGRDLYNLNSSHVQYSNISDQNLGGIGNLFGVWPRWENSDAGNFHVLTNSPMRSKGTNLGGRDVDNEYRPASGATDIGVDQAYFPAGSWFSSNWIARYGVLSTFGDADGDGLANYEEYRNGTNPNSGDTDGDGVSDYLEVWQAGNPLDKSDGGQPPPANEVAYLNLKIGDTSSSLSEKYMLQVGSVCLRMIGFGGSTNRVVPFRVGREYDVRIMHLGSISNPPDLDFVVDISPVATTNGASFGVLRKDPAGVLNDGTNKPSSFFTNDAAIVVLSVEFIDEVPDYSLDSNTDSDNFFLREYDASGNPDSEDLDIYYRILPEDVPVSDVKIKIYRGDTSTLEATLDGEKDASGDFKTGDNLHTNWTPSVTLADDHPGFYRVQLEVYVDGQAEPICQTSIDDADTSTPGWQCPQDGLAVHDLVWKHRPIVYLGTGEVVGPPQDPFDSIVKPWMRHRNGVDKLDPDSDTSSITPPPTYNDFGSLTSADTENVLQRSESTTNPYFDIHDYHLQATGADGVLWHYAPLDAGPSLKHNNYAFIQFWMYEPSSHGVFNNTGVGSNELTHEGDWEMCQFSIRLMNPDDSDTKKYWVEPFAATASQHYYGQTLLWNRNHDGPAAVDQDYVLHENDGNRVNIFIAENAHATYFRGGTIDTDIFKGCGTQVQYNNIGTFGYDRVIPAGSPTTCEHRSLSATRVRNWRGEWGQAYSLDILWWTVKRFAGPRSPFFREAQIEDGNDDSHLPLATDPEAFHNWCRKTSLSTEQELR